MKFSKFFILTLFYLSIIRYDATMAQEASFHGTTFKGGDGFGLIYKLDENGKNIEVIHKFGKNPGKSSAFLQLCPGDSNLLYGVLSEGGAFENGVVFTYNPDDHSYKKLADFDPAIHGKGSKGSLVRHPNGSFYGTSFSGGEFDDGVLYEFNPANNEISTIINFEDTVTGKIPVRRLCVASNGKIYGTTAGGINGYGTIFSYDPNNSLYSKEYEFISSAEGGNSTGGFYEAFDGSLYTVSGIAGVNAVGVIYKYDYINGVFQKLKDFNSSTTGSYSTSVLIEVDTGMFYGTTISGGANNDGTIFSYSVAADSLYIVKSFDEAVSGKLSYGGVSKGQGLNLYGQCYRGGSNFNGTLFKYSLINDSLTVLHNFGYSTGKGSGPNTSLFVDSNNLIIGLTELGGKFDEGVIYEFDLLNSSYSMKVELNDVSEGAYPIGKLLDAGNGFIYGTTTDGGDEGKGCIYRYSKVNETFEFLNSFNDSLGWYPVGDLVKGDNGKIYGICSKGGEFASGTIFSLNLSNGNLEREISFNPSMNGSTPVAGLTSIKGINEFYGYTTSGSDNGAGAIFRFKPDQGVINKVFELGGNKIGRILGGQLEVEGSSILGVSNVSNSSIHGLMFKLNPSSFDVEILHSFSGDDGSSSVQGLLKFPDGTYFGTTPFGGDNGNGVLYQYKPNTDDYNVLVDFKTDSIGGAPMSNMTRGKSGHVYGSLTKGLNKGYGGIYRISPLSGEFEVTHEFNGLNGIEPKGTFIELNGIVGIKTQKETPKELSIYPNPVRDNVFVEIEDLSREKVIVRVLDSQGKEVLIKNVMVESGRLQLPMSQMSPGIYSILIAFRNEMHSGIIIKE